uniref:Uncharacterized protein n=1 Tax=Rhodnius prolixus TaxID=13249 RepID=T1HQA6_RHOPR
MIRDDGAWQEKVKEAAYVCLKLLNFFWIAVRDYVLPVFKKPVDFKKYGQWAVITGSTDGIGKEFAKQLASKGMDICLISRNEEKLKNTAKEIEDTHGVKTKYIVADFTNTDVYDNIRENLGGMDIGILVNNVGIVAERFGPFWVQSEQFIRDQINVNLLSLTMMTSIVTPCMVAKKRGLILNMSSLLADVPFTILPLYCPIKMFMSMFGTCISHELKEHNIQMTTLTPGLIITKCSLMYPKVVSMVKKILPFFILTTEKFVISTFYSLRSSTDTTCGYFGFYICGVSNLE